MTTGQYMRPHNHIGDSDFTCIHYVKFNSKKHQSTVFHNANHWADDYQYLRPTLYKKLNFENEKHSYLLKYYKLPTKEDDFVEKVLTVNSHDIVLFLESLFNVSLIAPDIYHIDVVPSIIFLSDIYNIILISFAMILLSAIYPARKAANIIPSQSLKI